MKLGTTLACGALAALCGCAHRGKAAPPLADDAAYPLPANPGPTPMPKPAAPHRWSIPGMATPPPHAKDVGVGTGKHQYYDQGKRRYYYYDPKTRRYYWESGEPKR